MKDVKEAKAFFWPYDIFGYLLPGALVVAAVLCFDPVLRGHFLPKIIGSWYHATVIVIVSYVVGHLLASFSSLVMEGFWMRAVWGEPHVWLLDDTTWTLGGRVFRWFAKLFAPYSESFSAQYRTRLCAVYRDEFGIAGDGNPEPHEVFWTANGYLMENAGSIYQHLLHFVELYGFSRNGSMGFAAIALVAYFRTWTVVLDHPSDAGIALVWTFDCIAVPALVCSLLLFINYIKLFRRHQQAVLRCFLAVAGVDDEDGDEEGEPAGAAPTGRPDNLALSLSLQLPGGDNRTTSAS